MAIATGFTAERMLQIENSTITGGFVGLDGHLLLTTRAGDQIDAGNVKGDPADDTPPASTTVPGIIEIATNAETASGLSTDKAVTPAGMAWANQPMVDYINDQLNFTLPLFYAKGIGTVVRSGTATYSVMAYAEEHLDTTGSYNTANSRFTAPVAGIYEFSFSAVVTANVGGPEIGLYKNGVDIYGNLAIGYGAGYNTFGATAPVAMAKDDTVEVWVRNNNNVSMTIDRARSSFYGRLVDRAT